MDITNYISKEYQQNIKPERKFNIRKILILIMAAVLGAEALWAIFTLSQPTSRDLAVNLVTSRETGDENVQPATISLVGLETVSVGSEFDLKIELESAAPVDGIDIIIKYDPTLLEVVGTVLPSSAFPDIPLNKADQKLGKVYFSAVIDEGSGFSGKTTLGTIKLKAKAKGTTTISVEFEKGETVDSNVISTTSSRDILSKVNNLHLQIK